MTAFSLIGRVLVVVGVLELVASVVAMEVFGRALRDSGLILRVAEKIREAARRAVERVGTPIKIMDFCGTHEYTITRYGLRSLLPPEVELVAGPGCPVCVTPAYYVDAVVKLALDGVRVYTYGDVYKLPGLGRYGARSLAEARALGGDVVVVYSFLDSVKLARGSGGESVFVGVGFETTAPAVAGPLVEGLVPENLKVLSLHRLTPPVMRYVFEVHKREVPVRGVIAPGHVSSIIGARAWSFVAEEYGVPVVVAGFEPLDVMLAVLSILRMLGEGRARLVNEYSRVVTWEGNRRAQRLIEECFEVVDAAWRGLGFIPRSGLALRDKYRVYDAEWEYGIKLTREEWSYDLPPGCLCARVTLGLAKPTDCPFFMKKCTPLTPYGPCMVGSEGTCSIWARYGGRSLALDIARSLGLVDEG